MNDQFDDLARSLAQSVTRRQALRRFGLGTAGMLLASLGLVNKAEAGSSPCVNQCKQSCKAYRKDSAYWEYCFQLCVGNCPFPGP
jgi:hypothetical protein